jgi:hypothetical protein
MNLMHIVVDLLLAIAATHGGIVAVYGIYRRVKALARPFRRQLKHLPS